MVTPFQQRVYDACAKIPRGKVSTYKEIARAVHCGSCQAIGQALTKNPFAPYIPCHRVVATDGSLGGFAWGSQKKIERLVAEGIQIDQGNIVNFKKVLFRFDVKVVS
jgi:methylated-DNA-[protein]-cysteine S-methyltransferase